MADIFDRLVPDTDKPARQPDIFDKLVPDETPSPAKGDIFDKLVDESTPSWEPAKVDQPTFKPWGDENAGGTAVDQSKWTGPKPTRDPVLVRGAKQFAESLIPRGLKELGGYSDLYARLQTAEKNDPEWANINAKVNRGEDLTDAEKAIKLTKQDAFFSDPQNKEKSLADYTPKSLRTGPPVGIGEKIGDTFSGLASIMTHLLVFKKLAPPGTIINPKVAEAVAFEMATQAEGQPTGSGLAMGGILGQTARIPSTVGRLATESGLFAGLTAAEGGNLEDVLISAGVPLALGGIHAATKWTGFAKQYPKFDLAVSKRVETDRDMSHTKAREEVLTAAKAYKANPDDPVAQAEWRRVTEKYGGYGSLKAEEQAPPPLTPEQQAGVKTNLADQDRIAVLESKRNRTPATKGDKEMGIPDMPSQPGSILTNQERAELDYLKGRITKDEYQSRITEANLIDKEVGPAKPWRQEPESTVDQSMRTPQVPTTVTTAENGATSVPTPAQPTPPEANPGNAFYENAKRNLLQVGHIQPGETIGGIVQPLSEKGGFATGNMYFKPDGSISYITADGITKLDSQGNVISTTVLRGKEKRVSELTNEIIGTKKGIDDLEKRKVSENFKTKEVRQTNPFSGEVTVTRAPKTKQEMEVSTNKIDAEISKRKESLKSLEDEHASLSGTPLPKGTPDVQEVQAQAEAQGLIAPASEPTVAGGKETPAPVAEKQPWTISGKNADLAEHAKKMGLDGVNTKEKQSMRGWLAESRKQGIPEQSLDLATEIIAGGRPLPDVPLEVVQAGMEDRLGRLSLEFDTLRERRDTTTDAAEKMSMDAEIARTRAEFDLVKKGHAMIGTTAARTLVGRKMTLDENLNLLPIINEAQVNRGNKGKPLSALEEQKYAKMVEERNAAMKERDEMRTKVSEMEAFAHAKEGGKKRTGRKMPEARAKERKALTDQIRVLLKAGCY